jgi:hypothetical protein
MTCRDFVKYMIYVERGAEHLQFFLWHKDYSERFAKLPESEKVLSPEYKRPAVAAELLARPKLTKSGPRADKTAVRVIEKAFDAVEKEQKSPGLVPPSPGWSNPFNTPPSTADDASSRYGGTLTPFDSAHAINLGNIDHKNVAAEAFEDANVKLQPCMSAHESGIELC